MNVRELFDDCAEVYDQDRPSLIPNFDLFYGTLLRQIPFPSDAPIRILDVGAGTGLATSLVSQQYPQATFLLTDISEKMLAIARQRFRASNGHAFSLLDSRALDFDGEFDAVISALSIHHLDHDAKRDVYTRIFRALKPGGVFINAEQVLAPTPELEDLYQKTWGDGIRATGLAKERINAALERIREDNNAPLQLQLNWLTAAGFEDVDCWFKYYRFAVFGGRKISG